MSKKILFIGPQGSGKSTQAKLLADYLKVPYIATGDIFRQIASENSDQGRRVRQILESGKLVDDQTTAGLVEERVKQPDCGNGFIFDGYPRNLEQIRLFDPGFNKVIYLNLSDEKTTQRLINRGREDDTPEIIAQRLKIYHKQTDPILDYYQSQDLLLEINGEGKIEEIQQKLRDQING